MVERLFICPRCKEEEVLTNMQDSAPACSCGEVMERDWLGMNIALNVSKGTKKNMQELARKKPVKSSIRNRK